MNRILCWLGLHDWHLPPRVLYAEGWVAGVRECHCCEKQAPFAMTLDQWVEKKRS